MHPRAVPGSMRLEQIKRLPEFYGDVQSEAAHRARALASDLSDTEVTSQLNYYQKPRLSRYGNPQRQKTQPTRVGSPKKLQKCNSTGTVTLFPIRAAYYLLVYDMIDSM
jgi:hypothetical protein